MTATSTTDDGCPDRLHGVAEHLMAATAALARMLGIDPAGGDALGDVAAVRVQVLHPRVGTRRLQASLVHSTIDGTVAATLATAERELAAGGWMTVSAVDGRRVVARRGPLRAEICALADGGLALRVVSPPLAAIPARCRDGWHTSAS